MKLAKGKEMSETFLTTYGLSKKFGGVQALHSLNLNINFGEIHGLIGPNGAGKTTLINLITGIEKPSAGKIFFKGERIDQLTPESIFERGISRTFQDSKIISDLTVFENIAVGLIDLKKRREGKLKHKYPFPGWFSRYSQEKEIRERVEKAVEAMDLSHIIDRWADELVWFEKQLVQITRALISDSQFLLLDEPTAGMGGKEKIMLEDKLIKINQSGVTIMLVSHDMNFIRSITKKITVLDFGRKISEGPTGQVLAEKRVWEAYLGTE